MGMRSVALLAVVFAMSMLVAACGGEPTKDSYEHDVARIGRSVDRSIDELSPPDGRAPTAGDVRKLSTDLDEAADRLDEITPPQEVTKAHEQMLRGMRGVADAFSRLGTSLDKAGDDNERATLFVEFLDDKRANSAFNDLTSAQAAYEAQGYHVFGEAAASKPDTETATTKS